jgi:photosystem II stability/assembly factor-like uncharacterized protein
MKTSIKIYAILVLFNINNINTFAQWNPINSNTTEHLNSISFPTKEICYAVGNNGTILKTIDSGNTWQSLVVPVNIKLQAVHFTNAQNGFIVGDSNIVIKTIDGGQNFIMQQFTGNLYTGQTICALNADTIFIGGNGGMLKSTDTA